MMFLIVHLTVNLMLIFDDSGELFNVAAHFMVTNPVIRIVEPLLGLGFLVHIVWSFYLEFQNWKARPIKYNKKSVGESSSWASRNMLILGALVLVFLVIHIINFYWVIRFTDGVQEITIGGEHMEDAYSLVAGLFKASIVYDIIYVIGAILLGLHLSHGFWSSFHTLGLSNKNWMGRLQVVGKVYAIVIAAGFTIIPLYFLIKF
jgi:succinate dehydrogenase / fumarate reductase cytochrome b subunit